MIDIIQQVVITHKRDSIKVEVEKNMIHIRRKIMIILIEASILMIEDLVKDIEINFMNNQVQILQVGLLIEITNM